jgi:hypothetical protein
MKPLEVAKLVLSYPAICFWLSVFCFATAVLSSALVIVLNGFAVPSVSQMHSHPASRRLLLLGSRVSAGAMIFVALTTHNHAKRLFQQRGRRIFLDAVMIANIVTLVCIGFLGHFLITLFYIVSGLVWHDLVDQIPHRPVPLARGMNKIIIVSAAVACGCLALGRLAGSRLLASMGGASEILAVLVLHLRLIADGATVLGAKFLPEEVRPAIFNPNRFQL